MTPYYQDSAVTIYLGDSREIVPQLGRFDLLLTDPPYGIGADNQKRILSRSNAAAAKDYGESNWDSSPADDSLLGLVRDSCRLQIVWGGNYFTLPPCKGPLIWDKENTGDFADGEMAWNNLGIGLKIRRHLWNGMIRKGQEERQHPTQKPLGIMSWCLQLAGETAKTILDPFMGSGTTLVAAKQLGRKCTGIELNERYCEAAAKRLQQEYLPLNEASEATSETLVNASLF